VRILVATHNYPRFPGDPAGAFVQRLAAAAGEAGHDVLVVAPHAPGLTERERDPAGVALVRFRYAPERWERVGYRGDLHRPGAVPWQAALGVPAFLAGFRRAVRRAAATFRPDVLHAHWWFPSAWAAPRSGAPLVVTCHGSDIRLLDRGKLVRSVARRVFGRASVATTVSQFLADDLLAALPGLRTRVVVAPMPVDVERFARGRMVPKRTPPQILYAGNLLDSKGVDVLIDAYARLRRGGVPCTLRILGEGPAREALGRLAASLGVAGEIEWSRFLRQDQMPAQYGASTVTVLPTRGRAEGLGLTLVEALLAGSAVVGTPVGGIPEVVRHMETGLLARDGDADDLANQLRLLLADANLRERLTAAGDHECRRRFAPAAAARRFLDLYGEALGRQHAS